MDRAKRVCIVGAGAAGLPSIRHGLLYGFDVACYESQEAIGGLWRYKPFQTDDSSVMASTIMNSSKEQSAYSDFPPKASSANFMHNKAMVEYLEDYAAHHELKKYIKFGHRVLNIQRSPDYKTTGRWNVAVKDASGNESTEQFDGVLLCTGHHRKPHVPEKWPGQDRFKGTISHVHSYKDSRGYEGKTIAVVGVGNSGFDAAVELSRVATQVYLVSRRGAWIFNRIDTWGRPLDCNFHTRIINWYQSLLPLSLADYLTKHKLNKSFDHEVYGLKPEHASFSTHPTVNDDIASRLQTGTVKVVSQIERFTETGFECVDGTAVKDVEHVILATGYNIEFPIVEGGKLIKVDRNLVDVFELIFPLACERDTMGIIGLMQPNNAIMPAMEMQSRLFFHVLAGSAKLPPKAERLEQVLSKRQTLSAMYVDSPRHALETNYIPYMDHLAEIIGCLPPPWYSYFPTDPNMAMHALLSPIASYFYRIRGPHPWDGAREAILSIEDRIVKATNPRLTASIYSHRNESFVLLLQVLAAVFVVLGIFAKVLFF